MKRGFEMDLWGLQHGRVWLTGQPSSKEGPEHRPRGTKAYVRGRKPLARPGISTLVSGLWGGPRILGQESLKNRGPLGLGEAICQPV